MWLPGGLVFLLAMVVMFLVWASREESLDFQPETDRTDRGT